MRMLAPAQNTPSLAGAQDDGLDLGMFEAQPLDGVGEFDIDAEVVGIQFQLVAVHQAAGGIDIHGQRGDRAVERQFPVAVAGRVGLEIDHVRRTSLQIGDEIGDERPGWRPWPPDAARAWRRGSGAV